MSTTMMKVFVGMVLLALPLTSGCFTLAGGVLGGGTGAILGGGVGLCCGEPVEGMASGAAFGAGTGMIAGAVCDAVILSPLAIVSSVLGCNESQEAMTAKKIEKLCKAGVEDQVIITQIQQVGMEGPLSVKEIVRLKEKGVSTTVIQFAQQHPNPLSPSVVSSSNPSSANNAQLVGPDPAKTPSASSPVIKASATEPIDALSHSSGDSLETEAFRLFEATPSKQPYAQPNPAVTP